jgi:hypothetical protein
MATGVWTVPKIPELLRAERDLSESAWVAVPHAAEVGRLRDLLREAELQVAKAVGPAERAVHEARQLQGRCLTAWDVPEEEGLHSLHRYVLRESGPSHPSWDPRAWLRMMTHARAPDGRSNVRLWTLDVTCPDGVRDRILLEELGPMVEDPAAGPAMEAADRRLVDLGFVLTDEVNS